MKYLANIFFKPQNLLSQSLNFALLNECGSALKDFNNSIFALQIPQINTERRTRQSAKKNSIEPAAFYIKQILGLLTAIQNKEKSSHDAEKDEQEIVDQLCIFGEIVSSLKEHINTEIDCTRNLPKARNGQQAELETIFGSENSPNRFVWITEVKKCLEAWIDISRMIHQSNKQNFEIDFKINQKTVSVSCMEDLISKLQGQLYFRASQKSKIVESNNQKHEVDDTVNFELQKNIQEITKNEETKNLISSEFKNLVSLFKVHVEGTVTERDFLNSHTRQLVIYLDKTVQIYSIFAEYKNGIYSDPNTNNNFSYLPSKDSQKSGLSKQDIFDIKTLETLTALLSEQIEKVEKCDRAAEPEQWQNLEKQKMKIQTELSRLGCTLMAERMLTSNRENLNKSSLKLLIVLLDGGNKEVQRTLEQYWLGTREIFLLPP
ncbi:hypothetical protein HK096_010941 [Nowakowskiella sp. JEL0078]|nr:hypothetical protein HK096_010941 [Nowakowskiella sp. JEL0078]